MPDIAICITFFNQDEYIKPLIERLNELSERSRFCWELVIGVDHPSQKSREVIARIQSLKDKSVEMKVMELDSDSSLIPLSRASLNRMQLLRVANAPYALVLEGDDEYIDLFDEAILFLNKHSNFVGVAFNHAEFWESTHIIRKINPPYRHESVVNLKNHCLERKYFHSNCIVFRRKQALEVLMGRELYCNDTSLTKSLLQSGDLLFLDKEIMLYRRGIPSIYSGATEVEKILSELIVQEESLRFFPEIKDLTIKKIRRLLKKVLLKKALAFSSAYVQQSERCNLKLSMSVCKMMTTTNPFSRIFNGMKLWIFLLRN